MLCITLISISLALSKVECEHSLPLGEKLHERSSDFPRIAYIEAPWLLF